MKIGLMGGTFNPVHIGHIEIAYKVLRDLELSKVIFIPSGNPPHKDRTEMADASHRFQMVKLAIAGNKKIEVSDIEIRRKGTSYTLDTIEEIRDIYGKAASLYFIAGFDSVLDLPNWKEPLKILSLVNFIAVERPGFSLDGLDKRYRKRIITLRGVSVDISSSDIRKRIKEGKPFGSLVPGSVGKYIRENGLYI